LNAIHINAILIIQGKLTTISYNSTSQLPLVYHARDKLLLMLHGSCQRIKTRSHPTQQCQKTMK
jgi:hypothetical protein